MDIIRLTIPFLCLVTRQIDGATVARGSFTAAVYEHDVQLPVLTSTPLSRSEALDQMMINIRIYEQQARLASQKVQTAFFLATLTTRRNVMARV